MEEPRFDSGGFLPIGLKVVTNTSGEPEVLILLDEVS